ncbi:hypothetical protein Bhyg_04803 [Pseudolycoriella hygida]|uniref:Uncharacterized protein n=1 Tax=Pseudolycoriella hygida TaxID=35572 RepID=A0A9Q0SAB2_9DIPT|nr:hypothetical protein Bhyg_04803 [Pseudolycoriella hygida]
MFAFEHLASKVCETFDNIAPDWPMPIVVTTIRWANPYRFQQQATNQFIWEMFGNANNGSGKFSVSASYLWRKMEIKFFSKLLVVTYVVRTSFFAEFCRITLAHTLGIHSKHLLETRPNGSLQGVPISE